MLDQSGKSCISHTARPGLLLPSLRHKEQEGHGSSKEQRLLSATILGAPERSGGAGCSTHLNLGFFSLVVRFFVSLK